MSNKLKIVHICLCGPMTDGLNYQENIITKYHKKMGYDVTIIASLWMWNSNGQLQKAKKTNYLNNDGVKILRIPTKMGNVDNRLKIYPDLYKTVETEKPNILFIHDCQFLDICALAKYCKNHRDVTTFVDNHVDYSNGAHGFISKNILHKILWKYCVNRIEPYVNKFYGVLPARVDFLKDLYKLPSSKCELLVMGADDELVEKAKATNARNRIRKQYGINDEDFLIMSGGKLDKWKTQTLLLMKAVANIKNNKVRLLVFGSVTPDLIDEVKKLSDGIKIQYIGWIDSKESYDYFEAADLMFFPGRHSVMWEQTVGQGIPIIVKDWPGTHHIDLGGNARFLSCSSANEIEKEIESLLLNNKEYMKMKSVALEKGAKIFSYKNIAKRSINNK